MLHVFFIGFFTLLGELSCLFSLKVLIFSDDLSQKSSRIARLHSVNDSFVYVVPVCYFHEFLDVFKDALTTIIIQIHREVAIEIIEPLVLLILCSQLFILLLFSAHLNPIHLVQS